MKNNLFVQLLKQYGDACLTAALDFAKSEMLFQLFSAQPRDCVQKFINKREQRN